MLRVEGLRCTLGNFCLQDATFTVARGDYFVLLGESGAGKTVLLELLAGLIAPSAGQLFLDDIEITGAPIQQRQMGLVYQDHALFPHLSVRRNIAYPLARAEWDQVETLAAQVGATNLLERSPGSLSMGEAQRVALARTLARQPRLLLLDEPLAALDVQSRAAIRSLLRRLHAAGQTIIHVTHQYEEALALATRVGILEGGRIVQVGTPEEVFHHPRSRFIADFVGIKNFFRGHITEGVTGDRSFVVADLSFAISAGSGSGCVLFESDAVTVSLAPPCGSARNVFSGRVLDIEPVPTGLELTVDIGLVLYARVTRAAFTELEIQPGHQVWLSFKATALRFIPDAGAVS